MSQYCQVDTCLNSGFTTTADRSFCNCPFPFLNGPKGICELTQCLMPGTNTSVVGECKCNGGWIGERCQELYCLNSGYFDPFTKLCTCPRNVVGFRCDVRLIDYLPTSTPPVLSPSTAISTAAPPISSTATAAPPTKPSTAYSINAYPFNVYAALFTFFVLLLVSL